MLSRKEFPYMEKDRLEIAKYRLSRAKEELEMAKQSLQNNFLRVSLSNSYYSIFHAVRALFSLEGINSKTHKGVIYLFNNHFIKKNLLSLRMLEILSEAFEMRLDADYEDFYVVTREETLEQIENAEYFLNEIVIFIKKIYGVEL